MSPHRPVPDISSAPDTDAAGAPYPFLFDQEQIDTLGPPELIRAGLRHCNEQRVTDLARDEDRLQAEVEDAESQEKFAVSLSYDADGNLWCDCDCKRLARAARVRAGGPGAAGDTDQGGRGSERAGAGSQAGDAERREPDAVRAAAAPDESACCVHGIAALFAHGRRQGSPEVLRDALEAAIEERRARGRAEVRVEPLAAETLGTGPVYGTWSARSIQTDTHYSVGYRVHLRSLARRANYCTCPDFATNQLGTCKHIEAVLHRLGKRRDFKRLCALPPPVGHVWLDWETGGRPRIRLARGTRTDPALEPLLDAAFDAAGVFRGRVPEDFQRFAERIGERADLLIGDDARDHALRLAEDAVRAARAADIGERLRAGGGRLPGIRARLYPYQVEGVAFLAGRGRALLADDMGLGKTLQAIVAADWLRRHDQVQRVLVVCPVSLKQQWAREIQRFTGATARIVTGGVAARGLQYREPADAHIINYELAMRDLQVINDTLRPDLLILDEAQRIKNWRTKVASAVKRIGSRYAFVLTGTPLENRLEDLYSLMQVVDPRVLGPLWRYLLDFHLTDERGRVLGYRNLSELRRRLAPVMLRRDRALVRDQLPERIEQRLDVELSPKQRAIHDDALTAAGNLATILRRRPLTPVEQHRLMAALQRARMACNATALVDPDGTESPKLDELETILGELCVGAGLKAVIFSQWERMTELAEQRARRLGLGTVRLHGRIPGAKRGDLIERFRADDRVRVFISTDAGGTGLNLQNAALLVNLDMPWNPAVLDQRIARIHRLGQTQKVQILLLVGADSYEQRVMELIRGKRELFDNVVDAEATGEVVAVSRRLVEVLAEDLAPPAVPEPSADDGTANPTESAQADGGAWDEGAGAAATETDLETNQGTADVAPAAPAADLEPDIAAAWTAADGATAGSGAAAAVAPTDAAVWSGVTQLQERFGARIERILGTRVPGGGGVGLLAVLDQVGDADDRIAEELSRLVPVALIDRRTLSGLRRLGAASPIADSASLFEAGAPAGDGAEAAQPPPVHPLVRQAADKLEAAALLIQQACPGPALELLLGALLAAAARRAGHDEAPEPRRAGLWIHAEALPGGLLAPDEAGLLMRAIALSQTAEAVPRSLLDRLLEDAETFIRGALGGDIQGATTDPGPNG